MAVFWLPAALNAALSWDTMTYKKSASVADTEAVAEFVFQNTGENSIHVDSIRSSCGCTTAVLEKRDYAPGESGTIHVVFTFGSRVGRQHKTITVEYCDGGEETTVLLELFVDIPDIVEVTPRVQFWSVGSDPVARAVDVSVSQPGWTLKSAHMYSQHSNFKVSTVESLGENRYRFTIEPRDTSEAQTEAGELLLVEAKGGEPKKVLIYASVR